jgi:hypothetical protein
MRKKAKSKKRAEPVHFRRAAYALQMRIFAGGARRKYLVMRTPKGTFHVFIEVVASHAAIDCGSAPGSWPELWAKASI